MTDVRVLISGLIMLIAQNLYDGGGAPNVGAAMSIAVPVQKEGKYDVEIPSHSTMLKVRQTQVEKIEGSDKDRVQSPSEHHELRLRGDHVSFGQYDPKAGTLECKLFTPAVVDDKSNELRQIPRLKNVGAADPTLKPKAKPAAGHVFDDMNPKLVSAWLDFAGGDLSIKHNEKEELMFAEFRPSRHQQVLAQTILWQHETAVDRCACVVVDPYKDDDAATFDVVFFLKKGKVTIEYSNEADSDSGEPHEQTGYDFEMYYNVLLNPPSIPAVPHAIGGRHQKKHDEKNPAGLDISGLSGVNCGPAHLP